MASKALVLLGLFAVFLVVSEVTAASARQSGMVKSKSEESVEPDQYGGGGNRGNGNNGGGGYNGGGGNNGGSGGNNGGRRGGGNNGGGYNGGSGGNNRRGGGYCRNGCCYRGYLGCSRCCSYAGEAVQTQPGH